MTRRESLLAVAAPVAAGLVNGAPTKADKLNVASFGGHPDDLESGCGGTLARYSAGGQNVTIIYLTRGEAGIPGKTHDEAAAIRTEEALKACRVLGATPVFAGQIDGSSEITNARYEAFEKLLNVQQPDVVFTHWSVDTHRDHCAASLLTFQAWYREGKKYPLVYFDPEIGHRRFLPIQKASAVAANKNVPGAGSGVLTDGTTAIPASGSMLVPNWLSKTPEVEKS